MTDHAGPRLYDCSPGTKLWHPSAFVTQFWHPRLVLAAISVLVIPKQKQSSDGEGIKKYNKLNHFKQLFYFILVLDRHGRQNRSPDAKTTPRVPKLGYNGGWVPQLNARLHSYRRGSDWSVTYHRLKFVSYLIIGKIGFC